MKESALLRVCLIGLPLGLIAFGGGSLLFYQTPKAQQRLRDFGVQSRSIQEADLMKSVRDFAQVIGPRGAAHPEGLSRAASYIESTLGPHNAGFQVRREAAPSGAENLIIEIPGHRLAKDLIVIGAHYDAEGDSPGANDNATGMAALFGLAQSLAGVKNERAIRFIAFGDGAAPNPASAKFSAAEAKARGERILAFLCLDGLGSFRPDAGDFPESLRATLPPKADFLTVMGESDGAALVHEVATVLGRGLDIPVQQSVLGGNAAAMFRLSEAASFQELGYPSVLIRSGGSLLTAKPPDTLENVDAARFTKAVQALNRVVHALANPRS